MILLFLKGFLEELPGALWAWRLSSFRLSAAVTARLMMAALYTGLGKCLCLKFKKKKKKIGMFNFSIMSFQDLLPIFSGCKRLKTINLLHFDTILSSL